MIITRRAFEMLRHVMQSLPIRKNSGKSRRGAGEIASAFMASKVPLHGSSSLQRLVDVEYFKHDVERTQHSYKFTALNSRKTVAWSLWSGLHATTTQRAWTQHDTAAGSN